LELAIPVIDEVKTSNLRPRSARRHGRLHRVSGTARRCRAGHVRFVL